MAAGAGMGRLVARSDSDLAWAERGEGLAADVVAAVGLEEPAETAGAMEAPVV